MSFIIRYLICSLDVGGKPLEAISVSDTLLDTDHEYLIGSSSGIFVVHVLACGLMEMEAEHFP